MIQSIALRRALAAGAGLLLAAGLAGCGHENDDRDAGGTDAGQEQTGSPTGSPGEGETGTPDGSADLTGTAWVLRTFSKTGKDSTVDTDVPPPARATLAFVEGGEVKVFTGCNRGFGHFEQTDTTLTLKGGGTTMMACQGMQDRVERLMTAMFDTELEMTRTDHELTLADPEALPRVTLRFEPSDG